MRRTGGVRGAQLPLLLLAVALLSFVMGWNVRGPSRLQPLPSAAPPPMCSAGDRPSRVVDTPETRQPKQKASPVKRPVDDVGDDDTEGGIDGGVASASFKSCERRTRKHFEGYFNYVSGASALHKKHGPLRIAAFSRLWVPPIHGTGGMQYHALHLYSQLAAQGHDVHVFVTGPPGAHRVLRYRVDASLKLREVAGGEQPQLTLYQVASAHNAEYTEVWFANVLKRYGEVNKTVGGFHVAHSESWAGVPNMYQIGLPMAVTWHGSMLDWFRNEINLIVHNFRMRGKMTGEHTAHRMKDLGSSVAYEAYMLLAVPHHIVISDSAAEDLTDVNLIERDRVHLIYNGVNPTNFKPNPDARAAFLAEHDIKGDVFLVGCGGRLEGIKGHHQLARAMEKVLTRHKDVVLLVAGQGGERARYEALKTAGLRVVLLGMMTQQKLAGFYQSLDVFIDPFYQHHGLNTVMIEAVLSGTPLIATALASAATTVPCAAFGRTFPLGKVDALAAQVVYLRDHPEERKAIGRNVRERAVKLFTSEVMAAAYERVLYDAYLAAEPLTPITGKVVCKRAYPAMCYREPQ
jgi:glycosyltransferase involved in cell wall biosynthesis